MLHRVGETWGVGGMGGRGFEPLKALRTLPAFQAGALSLSATPMDALGGIEPPTRSFPDRRSTTELQGHPTP